MRVAQSDDWPWAGRAGTSEQGRVIPSGLDGDSSRLPSDAGRAHPRPLESHTGASRPRGRGAAVAARGPAMCQYQGSSVSYAGESRVYPGEED
jgi:hypothetical protein